MGAPTYGRLLAAAGAQGTLTFLQFASDGCGYIATLGMLIYLDAKKARGGAEASAVYVRTFRAFAYAASAVIVALLIPAGWYFRRELGGGPGDNDGGGNEEGNRCLVDDDDDDDERGGGGGGGDASDDDE